MNGTDLVEVIGALAGATVLILGALGALYVKIESVRRDVNGSYLSLIETARREGYVRGLVDGGEQKPNDK